MVPAGQLIGVKSYSRFGHAMAALGDISGDGFDGEKGRERERKGGRKGGRERERKGGMDGRTSGWINRWREKGSEEGIRYRKYLVQLGTPYAVILMVSS